MMVFFCRLRQIFVLTSAEAYEGTRVRRVTRKGGVIRTKTEYIKSVPIFSYRYRKFLFFCRLRQICVLTSAKAYKGTRVRRVTRKDGVIRTKTEYIKNGTDIFIPIPNFSHNYFFADCVRFSCLRGRSVRGYAS